MPPIRTRGLRGDRTNPIVIGSTPTSSSSSHPIIRKKWKRRRIEAQPQPQRPPPAEELDADSEGESQESDSESGEEESDANLAGQESRSLENTTGTFEKLRALDVAAAAVKAKRSPAAEAARSMTETTETGVVVYKRVPARKVVFVLPQGMLALERFAEHSRSLQEALWAEDPIPGTKRWECVEEWVKRVCDAVGDRAVDMKIQARPL